LFVKKFWHTYIGLILAVSMVIAPLASSCSDGSVTATGQTMTVTDGLGREVNVEVNPQKIVSLAPSNTEILFALGLGDRVYGVTNICNYPEEAQSKEKVGDYYSIDVEKVIAIDPDFILAEDLQKADITPALEELGFSVVTLVPHNIQEMGDAIRMVGDITGTQERAEEIVDDMEQRVKAITDITDVLDDSQRVRVLYLVWNDPMYSVGPNTYIHELIVKAGGRNIAAFAGDGWPALSLEQVINLDPQVVIANHDIPLDVLMADSRLAVVDAFKNGRVYSINADLTNRPGPRIVEGLETMARMIHPEIFGTVD
jgi:iron complex transport system substrate-binding protein